MPQSLFQANPQIVHRKAMLPANKSEITGWCQKSPLNCVTWSFYMPTGWPKCINILNSKINQSSKDSKSPGYWGIWSAQMKSTRNARILMAIYIQKKKKKKKKNRHASSCSWACLG